MGGMLWGDDPQDDDDPDDGDWLSPGQSLVVSGVLGLLMWAGIIWAIRHVLKAVAP